MPLPAIIQTSDTFNTWLNATNNLISHVANTSVFLQGQASASPTAVLGNTALSGTFFLSSLVANTNLTVAGTATMNVAAPTTISGATTISGVVSITNTLTQSGPVNISGALTITSTTTTISGAGTLVSNVAATVANTLTVTRATTLQNTVTMNGAVTMANTSAVTGAATFGNTIAVTGAATFSGAINAVSTLVVNGAVTLANTMNVAGTLTVTADSALQGNVFIGSNASSTTGYLTVRQTSSFQNTMSVAGLATFSAGATVSSGSFNVNGTAFVVNSTGVVTNGTWNGSVINTTFTAAKVITVNGQSPAANGNIELSAGSLAGAVDLTTAQTITGRKGFQGGVSGGMAQATGSLGGIEVNSVNTSHAAMIAFHRPGVYGAYFGLDTDNVFKVGGWTAGAVAHAILHAGNYTSYVPAKDNGVGATGTWPISITGSAGSATTATSATSATSASFATTLATSYSGDTAIATTAWVKNVLASPTYGNIAGNAATATALQTARTINGVSFNGTANISIGPSNIAGGTFQMGQFGFISSSASTSAINVSTGGISLQTDGGNDYPAVRFTSTTTPTGMFISTTGMEVGSRLNQVGSYSLMRFYKSEPKVDFIVGGAIPLALTETTVTVSSVLDVNQVIYSNAHYPNLDNQYDLGDNTAFTERWRTIYLVNPPNVSSDIRFKEVVQPTIPDALSLVKNVSPFLYYRKSDEEQKVIPGFAAQQVRDEIDAVLGTKIVTGSDVSLGMTHDSLLSILWSAVQTLAAEVESLRGGSGTVRVGSSKLTSSSVLPDHIVQLSKMEPPQLQHRQRHRVPSDVTPTATLTEPQVVDKVETKPRTRKKRT